MSKLLKAKDVPGAYDYYICGPDGREGDDANRAFVKCLQADSPLGKGTTTLFAKELMYIAVRRAGLVGADGESSIIQDPDRIGIIGVSIQFIFDVDDALSVNPDNKQLRWILLSCLKQQQELFLRLDPRCQTLLSLYSDCSEKLKHLSKEFAKP